MGNLNWPPPPLAMDGHEKPIMLWKEEKVYNGS
jgi:hypothetical protein